MKYLKYLCIGFISVFMLCGCEEQYGGSRYYVRCYVGSYSWSSSYVEVSGSSNRYFPNESFEVGILYSRTNSKPDFNQSGTIDKRQNVKSDSRGYLTTMFYKSDMNLVSKEEYYVRGYIRNKSGIAYSDIETFTAP